MPQLRFSCTDFRQSDSNMVPHVTKTSIRLSRKSGVAFWGLWSRGCPMSFYEEEGHLIQRSCSVATTTRRQDPRVAQYPIRNTSYRIRGTCSICHSQILGRMHLKDSCYSIHCSNDLEDNHRHVRHQISCIPIKSHIVCVSLCYSYPF